MAGSLVSAPLMARSDLEISLGWVDVECQVVTEQSPPGLWPPLVIGSVSCSLPTALERRLEKVDSRELMASLSDPKARYVAMAAMLAMDRFGELGPSDRISFVLEVAKREPEVSAGSLLGVVFGPQPWWEGDWTEVRPRPLGGLATPFDSSMVPAIRRVLAEGLARPPVNQVAVYLCTKIPGPLDPELRKDLERVVEVESDLGTLSMASSLLAGFYDRSKKP
ncbi:MAG: hypothetical protein K8J08_19890 [Thermoanaerobaculia bacterium]|nr:hypothetical protein [Thermoanaerobaculia bacterium]